VLEVLVVLQPLYQEDMLIMEVQHCAVVE
jgi:hypothetical protein